MNINVEAERDLAVTGLEISLKCIDSLLKEMETEDTIKGVHYRTEVRNLKGRLTKVKTHLNNSTMFVGAVVQPTHESGFTLHCGSGTYSDAVVVSLEPFILTSRESDMRWESTINPKDFEITGVVDTKTLNNCKKRL